MTRLVTTEDLGPIGRQSSDQRLTLREVPELEDLVELPNQTRDVVAVS